MGCTMCNDMSEMAACGLFHHTSNSETPVAQGLEVGFNTQIEMRKRPRVAGIRAYSALKSPRFIISAIAKPQLHMVRMWVSTYVTT